jgi:hypothetical protein
MLETYESLLSLLQQQGLVPLSANRVGLPQVAGLTPEEQWHTGACNDPWQWRIRVVKERKALFGKFFAQRPGFLSWDALPLLYAVRRQGLDMEEAWLEGRVSQDAYRLYGLLQDGGDMAAHDLKRQMGWTRENARFERALRALQQQLYVTCSGEALKRNQQGQPYGWPVMTYCTVEAYAGDALALPPTPQAGLQALLDRLLALCPATPDSLARWLCG